MSRPNQFKVLLSDQELRDLRHLSKVRGLTPSDYVRTVISLEREALGALKERDVLPTEFSHQVTLEKARKVRNGS